MNKLRDFFSVVLVAGLSLGGYAQTSGSCSNVTLGALGSLNGWVPSPNDAWHQIVVNSPIDPMSANILSLPQDLGGSYLTPNFSSPADGGAGIPYTVVDSSATPLISITPSDLFDSDNTLYPLPANVAIEGTPGQCWNDSNLHRALVLDRNLCVGYEVKQADLCSGSWTSSGNAIWDFTKTVQRPYGMSSADAAGLSIFEGLLRYDEIVAGVIQHALRFTAANTKGDANGGYFTAPATHAAGNLSTTDNIMGMRLRLRADFDISGFSATNRIILRAMQQYGMILADNGPNLAIEGTPDPRWSDSDLSALKNIPASAFDVLQMGPVYDSATAPTGAAPQIVSFTASQSNITPGTSVVLTPVVAGGSYLFIDSVGFIRGPVTVAPQTTTTYTLTSRNAHGTSTASVTVNVQGSTPTLTFAPIPSMNVGAPPFAVSATSNSSGAITYSVVSGPATISGNIVTLTGPGNVTLLASQAAAAGNTAATATTSFAVNNLARPRVANPPSLVSATSSPASGAATPAINTTGANAYLVCETAEYGPVAPTDSQGGHTYIQLANQPNPGNSTAWLYGAFGVTGAPSVTFNAAGNWISVLAVRNLASFDKFVGTYNVGTTTSITPTNANEFIASCLTDDYAADDSPSVSPLTLGTTVKSSSTGFAFGSGSAYAVQTAAASVAATWSGISGTNSLMVASFYSTGTPGSLTLSQSCPEAFVGYAYTCQLVAGAGVQPYTFSQTAGTLPAGLSLNTTTGVISGTPTATGTSSGLAFKVVDSTSPIAQSTSTAAFPITVGIHVQITTTSLPAGTQLQSYNASIACTGGTGAITYSFVGYGTPGTPTAQQYDAIPAGLTINPSTGAITGTIQGQGIYQPYFTCTDSVGGQDIKEIDMAIAGNNTFGGAQLLPPDSVFHLNVSALPVDTSPVAAIYTPYQAAHLTPLFGQYFDGTIPINTVPYNQPYVPVTSCIPGDGGCPINYFTSAPINCNAEMEGSINRAAINTYSGNGDNHILTVQLAGGGNPVQLWEMYQYYNWPYNNPGCHFDNGQGGSVGGYSNFHLANNSYAMTNGAGATDAAGLPVAPLLLNYDEVAGGCPIGSECGVVQHPVRFTLSQTTNYHVWPATVQAGLGAGSCSGGFEDPTYNYLLAQSPTTGNSTSGFGPPTNNCGGNGTPGDRENPMGEIYRLKASVATPAACSSNPVTSIIVNGFRNYGIILADNGGSGYIIGTPDSRWPADSVLQNCLNALTLANFEPVRVDQCATDWPNSSQATRCTGGLVAPTLAFAAVPNQTVGAAPFTVSATSNSSGAITYSVVGGPASISGNTITVIGIGTVNLLATQAAAANYTAGTATTSFTVNGLTPSLAFLGIGSQTYGAAPFTVSATSNSSGAITYSVVSGPATISGSTVTITGAGTVTLQASQAAAGNYAAAVATTSFSVAAASPTLTFAAIANQTYGAASFTVSATSNSSGAITYSVVSGPATVSGSTVTVTGAGAVTLQASQAATGSYAAATATTSFTVSGAVPTLAFATISGKTYGAAPFAVSATSNSPGAITYSVVSGPATNSGSTVTVNGVGTVTLQANQAAAGNYAAATATTSFTVSAATPALSFTVANQTYGAAPFTVSATSDSSGAISYSVVNGPATISGTTVTINGAGTVTLQASQVAAGNYTAATATTSFNVNGTAPTLTFTAVSSQTYGVAPFAVSATSNSSGVITYSVVSGPATISGSTVTITGAGTVTLQASQAASGGYNAATATTSFSVSGIAPTLAFAAVANQTYGVAPFAVSATSNSTGAITYSVVSGPATVSSNTIAITGVGLVTLQASQAAAGGYLAATATTSFTVSAAAPTLAFAVIASKTYGAAPFIVSATSNSPGAITYSVVSGPATNSGSTVTVIGVGTVTLQANQAAAGNYTAATVTTSFSVNPAAPTLAFTVANQSYGVAPFGVSATSNSSGAITYSVVSGPATISGSTVTVTGAGTVTLQASQAAAGNYTAATSTTSFNVIGTAPTLTFTPVANKTYGVAPFAVSATSNSPGAITYSVVSGPATISGSTVTLTGAGTVTLQASQTAAGGYNAATATTSFIVSGIAPTLTFASVANQTYGAAPFTVSASSNSAGAITYSVVSGPATVSGSTVTTTGAGTVTLQASQAAVGGYLAATATTSFTVSGVAPTLAFAAISSKTYGAAPFTVSATSNSSGAITYSVASGPATNSGSTVTVNGVGTVVLQANQAAAGNYTAATATTSFSVNPAAPTLAFTAVANRTYGAAPFTISATSDSSGAIAYSVVSGPATLSGSTVTVNGVGTVTLQASQAAAGDYTAATATTTFSVSAATPTLAFTAIPSQTDGAAPFTVSATSNSAGAITYSVVSGPATISGNLVTLTGSGTVTLQASQAAAGDYTAATATTSFSVAAAAAAATADFSLPASVPTITITQGQSGSVIIPITSENGFSGTVTISCELPSSMQAASCTASDATLKAAATANSDVNVSTAGQSNAAVQYREPFGGHTRGLVFLGLLAPFGPPLWRRRRAAGMRLALCFLLAMGLSGCRLASLFSMTPPGTYTVTVSATSGKITHSMNVKVVVQ